METTMRHLVLKRDSGTSTLSEVRVPLESVLQVELLNHPELLPTDDLGLSGELLVIGRETLLPSGRPDLLAIAETGDIVIVEMKRGPENSDFRRALAQLIDYGSDLWRMRFEDFEENVAVAFFQGKQCRSAATGAQTLAAAVEATWPDSENEVVDVLARVRADLRTGAFTYVLAAQSLTPPMERAIEYLNSTMVEARFYGVELIKFAREADDTTAIASRLVVGAAPTKPLGASVAWQRDDLVARFPNELRPAVRDVLELADRMQLVVYVGSVGASLKIPLPDRSAPVSIGWLYPPGHSGFGGTRDFSLGYAVKALEDLRSSRDRVLAWRQELAALSANHALSNASVDAVAMSWDALPAQLGAVAERLQELVEGPPDE
jgi:hypothetical protein